MTTASLENYLPASRRGAVTALAIFAAGLIVTAYFAAHEHTDSQREASREFDANCREIQAKIDLRLAAHEQILRSAAAFFADSDGISRTEWRNFAERQKIDKRFPGIQGLGFALVVSNAELAAHTLSVRAEGFPTYRVWPEGEREIYTAIIFLEPFTGRNLRAFGYDMFSEPVRRAAMERARDEDTVALSGKVTLVQEDGQDFQPGTLMFAPVYRIGAPHATTAERRTALIGWVYSPYRMGDLISAGIFGSDGSAVRQKIRLQVYDGHDALPDTLLYDSHPQVPDSAVSTATKDTMVEHDGRAWRLRFASADPRGVPINYNGFWLLLGSGSIVSTLLASLVFSWANTRYAARVMAARLTQDLRESEERARTLIESSPEAIIVHRAGLIIYVNPAAVAFAGAASAADLLGTPLLDRVHPEFRPLVLGRVRQMTTAHTSVPPAEMKLLKLDGTPFDVEAQATEITYDGAPAIRVVARDVTDFKRATAALRASEENYRLLFDGMLDGFALHEIICDATGRAVDYRFLSVNPAFERLTGLRAADIVGHTVLEVMPTTEHIWIERYGHVALTGEGVEFEEFSAVLNKHFEIAAFRPRPGQFATVFIDITVSKRAEAALRDSEERFRVLFEDAPDAMLLADSTSGRITAANAAASRLLDRPRAALVGLNQAELHPPRQDESPQAMFARHVREAESLRRSVPVETSVVRPDGTEIPVEILARTIRLHDQPTIIGTFRDITVRKQAQAALALSEERYRSILHASPDNITLTDLEGRLTMLSPAAFAMFGYDSETAFVHRSINDFIAPADRERATARLALKARGISTGPGEYRALRRDGSTFDIEVNSDFIRDETGRPTGIVFVVRDITERKRTEQALRDSEARFRVLFEGAPDAMILADPATGRVIDTNEAAGRLLGRPRAALVGLHQTELHPPRRHDSSQASFESHVAKAEAVGHTDPVETSVLRPDGTEIPVEILAQTIRLHDQPTIIGTFRDVTVRKKAEAALQASQEIIGGILNTIPARVFWKDKNLVYLGCNVAFAQDAGFADPQEIIGKDDFQMGWRNEAELYRADDRAVIGSGTPKLFIEETQTTPDGNTIVLLTNKVPLRNATGEITGLLGTYTDITKWKRAEAALRASEEQFRSYIEHSPMGVFLADDAGCYVGVNQAAARTTGYTEAELLTMRVTDLAPLEASTAFDEHFQRLVQFGNSRGEVPFRRKDGSVGYWIVDAVRLSPARVLGFTVETTERKAAEQKLAESRDLLANLARLVPGVVYQYRLYPDGRSAFPFASPGMHEIYELSPAEVREDATPVFGRLHPEDVDRVSAAIFESARTLDEFFCEFRVVLPHQGLRWRWCQAHPERTPDGGTLWHGIISDVTDRKEAELDLHASLREKEALLKEVHHRVKNNLQVIMSLLRMEGRRSTQTDTKSVLGEMQSRIRSMALLHESLYRSGTFAAVDLSSYLTQLATQAFRYFQAASGTVRLHLTLTPVLVEMDQALPCGLLVNELLSNSLKHAFPGGRPGGVHVDLQPLATEPGRWCLAVSDDGVGLPADLELRRSQSLGLQLVADLAGQLHGTLAISAGPGDTGTRLAVTFNIVAPPPPARP